MIAASGGSTLNAAIAAFHCRSLILHSFFAVCVVIVNNLLVILPQAMDSGKQMMHLFWLNEQDVTKSAVGAGY